MAKMGRPKVELTQKIMDEIMVLVIDGRSVTSICTMMGFSKQVYYRWNTENKDFNDAVHEARVNGKVSRKTEAEECVQDCIRKGDGKLALDYLQCTIPSEYAKRRIQDNTHNLSSPFDRLLDVMKAKDETEKK